MNHDPHIPLHDVGVYSFGDGKSVWQDTAPDELRRMLQDGSAPAFRTALAKTGEDTFAGPWYLDIDHEEISDSISALHALLDKLDAIGLDLASVRIFATGKKGFHLEIPSACFMSAPGAVDGLPRIYKAMALAVFVDGLDLRVFSGGRGRLWRVPNVQRENGMYKVPVSSDEALSMTCESYAELVSSPRAFPALVEPVFCPDLAALFDKARGSITEKAVRSWSRAEAELRARFGGDCPPSLSVVLKGEVASPVGFNTMAIQVGLLAHALGWDEDRLVTECAGLIANHESDGRRYDSPLKRENELRRMFHYCEDNEDYSFSVAGLRSILPPGAHSPDLQGLEADAGENAPDYVELLEAADGDAGEVLAVARQVAADPALSRTEAESLLKRAAKSANVAVKVLRSDLWLPTEDQRMTIRVQRSDFAASVDSALAVLPSVPGLRVRSGSLVEVVRSGKSASISSMTAARFAYLLSQRARWSYGDAYGQPDPGILQAVLAAGYWPGVPELVGLLHQPTITEDSSIVADVGNYAGLEVVFSPRDFPTYEGSSADALAELRNLLREFPFATALDEAAALAAILTAAARPMLRTAPAFLVSACDLGSGKSYLAELIALFAGEDVPMQRWAQRAEEQDKMLMSVLLEARPVCVLDNLVRDWQSPTLAAILTGPTYSDRVLGGSVSATVGTRCLFIATGNNVAPVKDLSRRVVTIHLDAGCESPMLRDFKGDPVGTVRTNRGRFVLCALRVLQGFLQSGAAPTLPPVASFGEWSKLVRGALVHNGLQDPVRALVRNVEHDEDRDTLRHILEAWHDCFGDEPTTLHEAVRTVQGARGAPYTDHYSALRHLFEEVAEERGEINVRRLGTWFKGCKGRVVGGLRLVAGDRGREGMTWRVLPV